MPSATRNTKPSIPRCSICPTFRTESQKKAADASKLAPAAKRSRIGSRVPNSAGDFSPRRRGPPRCLVLHPREPTWKASAGLSDRFCTGFSASNADCILNRENENLAVADFSGSGATDNCIDCRLNEVFVDADFYSDLFQKVYLKCDTAVGLGVALLLSTAESVGNAHLVNLRLEQLILHAMQHVGLN